MRRKYSLRKLEQLMKEENNESLSYRDAKRWSKQQEQKQERCKSCHSNNVPCEKYLVACSSPTCRYSGERCSREDDELYDRICQGWRRVKRTHFDEIAKKLPKSHCEDGLIVGKSGKTTKLLTPWFKSHLDLEDDEDDDEEEEKSDHDNGFQSEETAVHSMADEDDDDESESETDNDNAPPPSKRKRRRNSDDDSEYEGKPPSRKELEAAILSLKDKEKQSAEELRKLKIEKQSSDRRQRESRFTISKLEADIVKMKRNNATSKEQDRTLIHKWEKQAKETSAASDELRRKFAKLQEAYARDKNETEPGSSTSRHVSQAPREENMAKQDMLMQQDVPMPAPTDINSELQEEIRTLKEKQKADAVTEAELRQTLHRTEKTSALKEAGLKREIQALNASREAIIATETELRREVRALIDTQEATRELMTRQEASTAARETELRHELQSLREGLESANVAERNLLSKLVKVKEDQQRQSKDEHYELSTVLQSLRRGIPRPDLADVVQMQIPIIERLADRRVLLNLPEMDTSD